MSDMTGDLIEIYFTLSFIDLQLLCFFSIYFAISKQFSIDFLLAESFD